MNSVFETSRYTTDLKEKITEAVTASLITWNQSNRLQDFDKKALFSGVPIYHVLITL